MAVFSAAELSIFRKFCFVRYKRLDAARKTMETNDRIILRRIKG